jgi:SM-20-related protein
MNHATPSSTCPVVILDEFLAGQEWRALLDFTHQRVPEFTATQVLASNGDSYVDHGSRRSRVLFDIGPFQPIFQDRLLRFLPHVLTRLQHPHFDVRWVEAQLTGTNNGEFFRMHTDNDAHDVQTRAVTFVYFFHREPRAFEGGELRLYDTYRDASGVAHAGPARVVFPLQNQVVLFPSHYLHEILPVGCASGHFLDSRFTVNGWFHR